MKDGLIFDAAEALEAFAGDRVLAVDLETTGFSPYQDRIAVLSVASYGGDVAVIQTPKGVVPAAMRELLAPREVITHNGTNFDLLFLAQAGVRVGKHYDTLVGEQVLNTAASWTRKNSLAATMQRRLGKVYKLDIDHKTWQADVLTEQQLAYAAADVAWLHNIRAIQESEADRRGLSEALQKEQALTQIVVQMQLNGIPLHFPTLIELKEKAEQDSFEARALILDRFGEEFNVNSPRQVKASLNAAYDLNLKNTRAETLAPMRKAYPLIDAVLITRQANKRTGIYNDDWLNKYVFGERIHGRYRQLGAGTKRFTSSDPNMQQIPREWRAMFGREKGKKVIKADWSQIELRVVAHLFQDDVLRDVLTGDEDLHTFMACTMFGVDDDSTTPEIRRRGKAGTFTFFFGGGMKGVIAGAAKWGTVITQRDAQTMLGRLAKRFRVTKQKINDARKRDKYENIVTINLPWGHQRTLRREERTAATLVNTPVQGTAAIGLKEALFEAEARGLLPYLSAIVHDEIVLCSVPDSEAEDVAIELAAAMEAGMRKVCYSLPTPAEVEIGDYWK